MRVTGSSYLERAFSVLSVVNRSEQPLTLSEVAVQLDLPKPTALRILRTLEELGFIESPVGESAYRGTPKVFELLPADVDGWLRERAAPIMQQLYDALNETVNLGRLDGLRLRYVRIIESTRALRWTPDDRAHDELLSTALGRAIVAFSPEDRFDREFNDLCDRVGYRKASEVESIRKVLRLSQRRGYAEESGQSCEGVSCFAVPLFLKGDAIAAVSVSVPDVRAQSDNRLRIIETLTNLNTQLEPASIGKAIA